MGNHPHHLVRQQKQFDRLQQLRRDPHGEAWGVKLKLGQQVSGTWWQANAVKWIYGATALEALDAALAYLVAESLKE